MEENIVRTNSGYITKVIGIIIVVFAVVTFIISLIGFLVGFFVGNVAIFISLIFLCLFNILYLALGATAIHIGKQNKTFRVGVSITWSILLPLFGALFLIDSAVNRRV